MAKFYSVFVISCLIQLCLSAPAGESDTQTAATTSASSKKIEASLLDTLKKKGKANIFLKFQSTDDVLKNLNTDALPQGEKATAVHQALVAHSEATQATVKAFLTEKSITFTSLWINNVIYISDANLNLVENVAKLPDVVQIGEEGVSYLL